MIKRVLCIALGMILGLSIFALIPLRVNAVDMQVSNACVELIKRMEGFTPVPKWDYSQWTVGFGTTCPEEHRQRYTEEGIPVEEAEALLAEKLIYFDERVNSFMHRNNLTLTQGQYDAIFSLTYNCGAGWLSKSEGTLYQAIVNGVTGNEFIAAFSAWCTAGGGFLSGLMSRRLIEAEMYLYGRYSTSVPDYYSYVKYNANGGERSAAGQGYDTRYAAKPMATATYKGHTFLGWYTEAEGGSKVTSLDASYNGKTLYAHWAEGSAVEPIDTVSVTVTADVLNVRAGAGTGYSVVTQATEGTKLDISAVATVGSSPWGLCDKGWVSLDYTNYAQVAGKPGDATGGKIFATITASAVNVRTGPGASYTRVTTLHSGDVVEVLEQTDVDGKIWGRYEGGWFRITGYATLKTVSDGDTEKPDTGNETEPSNPGEGSTPPPTIEEEVELPKAPAKATILGTSPMVIRNGPHKGYPSRGKYAVESRVEILEFMYFMGEIWGRTDLGWIPVGDYVMLNDADTLVNTFTITVTAKSLYVRNGPGAGCDYVRTVNRGAELEIYAIKDVNGSPWGRIYCGWINLQYTNYDPSMVPDQTPKEDCETLGHQYSDQVTAPTCTEKGYTTHTCDRCGHSYTDTEVEARGHQYSEQVTAPTCTEKGYTTHTCEGCGHSYTDSEVPATGHSYVSVITPPTKQEQGYTTHTCSACDHSYVDSYTDPVKDTVIIEVTKTYATVTASAVNVRVGAGASYAKVTTLHKGDVVEIFETKDVDGKLWGRYADGWFRLTGYTTLRTETIEVEVPAPEQPEEPETPTEPDPPETEPEPPLMETVTKTYATVTAASVNVRKGAGASFAWVTTLHKGDVVEILETKDVDGKLWGRYADGWFRLTGYTTLRTETIEVEVPSEPETPAEPAPPVTVPVVKEYATITVASVNVRKGAGASFAWVTTLHKGDVVEILEKKEVDGKIWGRYEGGWFRITGYATLKTVEEF